MEYCAVESQRQIQSQESTSFSTNSGASSDRDANSGNQNAILKQVSYTATVTVLSEQTATRRTRFPRETDVDNIHSSDLSQSKSLSGGDKEESTDVYTPRDTQSTLTVVTESFKTAQNCTQEDADTDLVTATEKTDIASNYPPIAPSFSVVNSDFADHNVASVSESGDKEEVATETVTELHQATEEDSILSQPEEQQEQQPRQATHFGPTTSTIVAEPWHKPKLSSHDDVVTTRSKSAPFSDDLFGNATVLYVNEESDLFKKSVYKVNSFTKLPKFDDKLLGRGGNAHVRKCYINTPEGDELTFACKIEKKKPLCRLDWFEEICKINKTKHFVVVHAYLKKNSQTNKPYNYVGYLIMEYFPLGNIPCNLEEFSKLNVYHSDIALKEVKMKEQCTDEDFGSYRSEWQEAHRRKDKVMNYYKRLLWGIYDSLKCFHNEYKFVHLDVKGHNFLLRKTCEHKDTLICECDSPSFDVLLGDFDYAQKIGALVHSPKHVGTKKFQAPSMRSREKQIADPVLDMFGFLVIIVEVKCELEQNQEGMQYLRNWDSSLCKGGIFTTRYNEWYISLNQYMETWDNQHEKLKELDVSNREMISTFTKHLWDMSTEVLKSFMDNAFSNCPWKNIELLMEIVENYKTSLSINGF